MKRAIDTVDGVTTWFETGPDGRFAIRETQDAAPIVAQAKAHRDAGKEWYQGDWYRHVGRIPNVILMAWLREAGVSFQRYMTDDDLARLVKRKLQDPNWRDLRVGKV